MLKITRYIIAVAAAGLVSMQAHAGTVSYVAIPSQNSDASSGISPDNVYTSAVDGGNTGAGRVVNGVTLTPLPASGNTSTAGGITINALTGTLSNSAGGAGSIASDGALAGALQDMTFNDSASDGSQQELVLDPATLVAGKTYDLRVYICNPAGQNRQVNLSFACDGQAPVETGFFNEDDATTSGGAFADKNQVYYINYRFTWDGATTPGITVTQKSGAMPFVLYAMTNQEVNTPQDAGVAPQADVADQEPVGSGPGQDVGVESEQFYDNDGLNRHGRWVVVGRYGRCWQPEGVAQDWAPYTRGHWVNSNYGWTWVSDEDEDAWGWATYHYGRWCHVQDAGWCWVPGRVWAPAWVSWRHNDECVGWAPLPPEAVCAPGVGISVWADSSYGLGPGAYNFVSVQNFGAPNLAAVLFARQRNAQFVQNTVNVTNIVNNNTVIYNGGPNVNVLNAAIARQGGRPVPAGIVVNRKGFARPLGDGRFSQVQGNVLTLAGPRVLPAKNIAGLKPAAATFKTPKFDKGWKQVADQKEADALRKKIALDSKGKTPGNTKAMLPQGVKLAPANVVATTGPAPSGLHPGKGFKKGAPGAAAASATAPGVAPAGPLHPGQKFPKNAAAQAAAAGAQPTAVPGTLHPGKRFNPAAANAVAAPGATIPAATPAGRVHPGQAVQNVVGTTPVPTPGKKGRNGKLLVPVASPSVAPAAVHPGQALPVTAPNAVAQPSPVTGKHGKQKLAPAAVPATPVTAPANVVPAAGQPVATPSVGPRGRNKLKTPGGPATTSASSPAVAVQSAEAQKEAAAANLAKHQQAAAAAQQQQAAKQQAAAAQQQQAAAAAERQKAAQAAKQQAAAAQQQQAAAGAAERQKAAQAAKQQQAAAQQQGAAAAAAAERQKAAAAQQQQAAAIHQQQAAAAAAAHQQQAAAAAAKQQQAAAAAAAAKAGKPVPTPAP